MTETEKLLRQAKAIALANFPDASERLLISVFDRLCIEHDMDRMAVSDALDAGASLH
ncbi:hypothetical protein NJI34_34595 [Pseudomonas sp. S 311-6]|nr:hypothetical protein [Pseudomonas sp. S 311-6]